MCVLRCVPPACCATNAEQASPLAVGLLNLLCQCLSASTCSGNNQRRRRDSSLAACGWSLLLVLIVG